MSETAQNPNPNGQQGAQPEMQVFLVPQQLMQGIFNYLGTRPANEVLQLMNQMGQVTSIPFSNVIQRKPEEAKAESEADADDPQGEAEPAPVEASAEEAVEQSEA